LPEAATLPALETIPLRATVLFMENQNYEQRITATIRELYPALSEAELKEAEANLHRYFRIAAHIQKELAGTEAAFDTTEGATTMEERSNANLKS
jgi:hypothetical protein